MAVINGGSLTGGCCLGLGINSGKTGILTVSGPGSTVSNAHSTFVGWSGTGEIVVENGGSVFGGLYTVLGAYNGSSGTVTVTGANSLFESGNGYDLLLGGESAGSTNSAQGTLNLLDGGTARANGGSRPLVIANSHASTGTVNIGNGGAAGIVDASSVRFGNGTGTLNFDHNDVGYNFATPITGNGTVNILAGTTIFGGANSHSGETRIEGGELKAGATSAFSSNSTFTVNGGTLNLNDIDQTVGGLSGSGGNVTLGTAALTVNQAGNTSFAGGVSGAGSLTKTGAGTLILAGTNSYSGGTTVSGGTLKGNSTSLQGNIVNNAALIFNQAADGTYAGVVSGTGSLTKFGTGTLTLSGANSQSGVTSIQAGEIKAGATGAFSSNSTFVVDGGTLNLNDIDQTVSGLSGTGGNVTLGTAVLTVNQAGDTSFVGVVSGTGSLTKTGAGALILAGANTYTGGTTVSGGTLKGNATSLQGNIVNNAALIFNQAADGTYAGNISGSGTFSKFGTGTLTLSGANSQSGATSIEAGELKAGGAGAFSSNSTFVLNSGTLNLNDLDQTIAGLSGAGGNVTLGTAVLTVNQAGDTSFAGIVSGTGSLTKSGAGALTLSGNNTFSGGITVAGGKLTLGSDTAAGTGVITTTGSVIGYADGVNSAAAIVVNSDTTQLEVNGTDEAEQSGIISEIGGARPLEKIGTGTLTLSGANTYTGGTQISAGTLKGNSTSLQGDIANNAALVFEQTANGTYAGGVSGTGSLTKTGTGTLILSGANSYSGGTTVSGGTLQGNTTSLQGDIANNAALIFNQASNGAYAGGVSGTGSLTKTGAGTLTLSGDSSGRTGATSVSSGGLLISGQLGSGATEIEGAAGTSVTVSGGGSSLSSSEELTVGDDGTGALTVSNGGAVSNTIGIVGKNSSATGEVTVAGPNSTWTNSSSLHVGFSGNGALTISGGGMVSNSLGYIGANSSGNGEVTVTGAGSTWANSGEFIVGRRGAGTLTVSNGGAVSSPNGYIGNESNSTGVATVTGAGSTWTTSQLISLAGENGTGTLTIADGGLVKVNNGSSEIRVTGAGGTGTVNIGAPEGSGATAAGTLQASGLVFGAGNSTLNFNHTDPGYNFTAPISGNGTVNIVAGTTIFGAANSNSGETRVENGELRANAVGAFSANSTFAVNGGTLNLNDIDQTVAGLSGTGGSVALGSGTLNVNQAGDTSYAGVVSGTGSLTKSGNGTLILTGANSFSGGTTVSGGILSVNGSTGFITVDGGQLGGNGTLGGAAINTGGTFAPGNSIGTTNISGNVTFNAGSVYEVEVDDGGNAAGVNNDLISATGTATLDNGASVNVLAENGTDDGSTYAANTSYTVLTAAGGVSGTFGTLTENFAFLDAVLGYDATNVFLTLTRNDLGFASVGQSSNQKVAAAAIDAMGNGTTLYDAIVPLSAPQANGAFDDLSGEAHATAKTAMIDASGQTRGVAIGRIRAANGGVSAPGMQVLGYAPVPAYTNGGPEITAPAAQGLTGWGQIFGSLGRRKGDANSAGSDISNGGFLLGIDAPFSVAQRFGLLAGYSRSNVDTDDRASTSTADNFHLGAYGSARTGRIDLRFGGIYSWHRIETGRNVVFPGFTDTLSADYRAGTAQIFGEAGFEMRHGATRLEPFAGLAYVNQATEGFTESGAAAALTVASSTQETVFTTLGLRAERPIALGWAQAEVSGALGWRHGFGDIVPTSVHTLAGGGAFSVAGAAIDRDVALVETGFDLMFAGVKAGISYEGEFGSRLQNHVLMGTLRSDL